MSSKDDKTQLFIHLEKLILTVMKEHDSWVDQRAKAPVDEEIKPADAPEKKRVYALKRWLLWLKSLFTKSRNKSTVSAEDELKDTYTSSYFDKDHDFSFSIDSKVSNQKSSRLTKKASITKQHTIKIRVGQSAPYADSNQRDRNG
ncbi:hypothetical protein [Fluviicola taffensis]|uniref:hypothetical protein n=1 Tax=Fluviicola taffensis TaxID=191579 RepID=UPI00313774D8